MTEEFYTHWRVWKEDDGWRVARDRIEQGKPPAPQHLEAANGYCGWFPHREGAQILAINFWDFVQFLKEHE